MLAKAKVDFAPEKPSQLKLTHREDVTVLDNSEKNGGGSGTPRARRERSPAIACAG